MLTLQNPVNDRHQRRRLQLSDIKSQDAIFPAQTICSFAVSGEDIMCWREIDGLRRNSVVTAIVLCDHNADTSDVGHNSVVHHLTFTLAERFQRV